MATKAKLVTKTVPTPKNWKNLKPHALAELTEYGAGINVDALAAHMKLNGFDADEAIVLFEGAILDGRHRHAAAITAGVVPRFCEFVGKDPKAHAAKKILRQHLNESQRARIAVLLTGDAEAPIGASGMTQAEAAETMQVGKRQVQRAAKVREKGTEAVDQALADGTARLGDAEKIVDQPPEVQDAAVEAVRTGTAPTLYGAVNAFAMPDMPEPTVKPRKKSAAAKKRDDEEQFLSAFDDAWEIVAAGPSKVAEHFPSEQWSDEFQKAQQLLHDFRELWVEWRKNLLDRRRRRGK